LTLDALASDLAIALNADPGNHFVRIWRQEDAWGWDWGQESVPTLAGVVYAGRVDNSDVDLLTALTDYDRYATELKGVVAPRVLGPRTLSPQVDRRLGVLRIERVRIRDYRCLRDLT
jgi:hypothetical protein